MALVDAVRAGYVDGLRALRDKLAEELDRCESARDFAALTNRLESVLASLNEADPVVAEKAETGLDEIRKKREALKQKTG